MYKYAYLLLAVALIPGLHSTTYAQQGPRPERMEKIESMKVGFITQKLDLTPEEAKVFWPVYNQYENELRAIRKDRRDDRKDVRTQMETMSDKDLEKLVDEEIISKQRELDVRKKFHAQFKQVLPIRKVAMLYRAEEDFKRELLKRLQERKDF